MKCLHQGSNSRLQLVLLPRWLAVCLVLGLGWTQVRAAPFAYITHRNSNIFSVIDTATNSVTATIPVGRVPNSFGQFIGLVGQ
jgi:YVTN family beta-propeller protein